MIHPAIVECTEHSTKIPFPFLKRILWIMSLMNSCVRLPAISCDIVYCVTHS